MRKHIWLSTIGLLPASSALQAQWQLRGPSPAAEVLAAVYDEARGVTVAVFPVPTIGMQTWEWDGSAWLQNAAAGWPGAAYDYECAMVYDPRGQRVMMLVADGPGDQGGWLYEYRGQSWTALAPGAVRPPAATVVTAAAFDTVRGVLVAQVLDQTWEWNGQAWALRAVTTAPGRTEYGRMAFDPLRQRTLLVGGQYYDAVLGQTVTSAFTWEWDGAQWTVGSQDAVSARVLHAVAYDATRGRVVLYGGANTLGNGPIWIFYPSFYERLGNAWAYLGGLSPTNNMDVVGSHLAVDLARGRVVFVGSETWEFQRGGAPTFARFGAGCAGAGGVPQLDLRAGGMAWVGQSLLLRLSSAGAASVAAVGLGLSRSQWGTLPLPVPIPGMGSCLLRISPDEVALLPAVAGVADFARAVPNAASLVGLDCFAQGLVSDATANPLGLLTSNGVALRIGVP